MLPALLIFLAASSARPVVDALPPLPPANLTTSLLPPPPVWVDDAENLTTTAETVLSVQVDPQDGLMEEEEIGVAAAAGGGFFKHTSTVRPSNKQTDKGGGSFLQPLVDFIRSLFSPARGGEEQPQQPSSALTRLL